METIKTHDLTPAPRKRALPRVWKRFYQLKKGETFFLGTTICAQISFSTALVGFKSDGSGRSQFIAPWKRVRTTELVRAVKPEPLGVVRAPIPFPSECPSWDASLTNPDGTWKNNLGATIRQPVDSPQTGPSA